MIDIHTDICKKKKKEYMKSTEQLHIENDWIMATIEVHWPPFAEPFIYVYESSVSERNTPSNMVSLCVVVCKREIYWDGIARARVQHFASSFFVYRNKYLYVHNGFIYEVLSLCG